ncbi:MAG: arylsulfatase family protein [Segetibacter sp.]|nr:arylsulfatase family protein [Segetibacter sp.]
MLRTYLFIIVLFVLAPLFGESQNNNRAPNIVFILTDDLGYGDVKYLNKEGKIKTPNMDRIGKEGMAFTDAHSSSAVCTPSRYSILTGRYSWRTKLNKGVLYGYSEPLIDSGRLTVASLLQSKGYSTACIGKWHLGMTWPLLKDGPKPVYDYTKAITNGPTSLGFDYFYGISASLDMPPFIYIENDHTVGLPTVTKKWGREGPAGKDFEAENCVPDFTTKAVNYIKEQSGKNKPFFLYFALPSPHTPLVPNKQFKDKTGVTEYGDYVAETDWSIGEILKALDQNGVSKNTLVIFTSDNGFAPYVLPKYNVEALGHYPSYGFRGYKADIWEGGHRIPFLVRWPGKIKPSAISAETICLSDFMATAAAIVGDKLPANSAEDSYNILPYFAGSTIDIREATVHHSINGYFAIRQGKWKLELCPGSGGWAAPRDDTAFKMNLPAVQLFDLSVDIKEQDNVQAQHPDVVKKLTALLQKYASEGRSTSGVPQKNDREVDIWNNKASL